MKQLFIFILCCGSLTAAAEKSTITMSGPVKSISASSIVEVEFIPDNSIKNISIDLSSKQDLSLWTCSAKNGKVTFTASSKRAKNADNREQRLKVKMRGPAELSTVRMTDLASLRIQGGISGSENLTITCQDIASVEIGDINMNGSGTLKIRVADLGKGSFGNISAHRLEIDCTDVSKTTTGDMRANYSTIKITDNATFTCKEVAVPTLTWKTAGVTVIKCDKVAVPTFTLTIDDVAKVDFKNVASDTFKLKQDGTSSFTIPNLRASDLTAKVSGNSTFTVNGRVKTADLTVRDISKIIATGLDVTERLKIDEDEFLSEVRLSSRTKRKGRTEEIIINGDSVPAP